VLDSAYLLIWNVMNDGMEDSFIKLLFTKLIPGER